MLAHRGPCQDQTGALPRDALTTLQWHLQGGSWVRESKQGYMVTASTMLLHYSLLFAATATSATDGSAAYCAHTLCLTLCRLSFLYGFIEWLKTNPRTL